MILTIKMIQFMRIITKIILPIESFIYLDIKNFTILLKIINIIRGESIFIETIICGVYYNEEIVNDAIVLFYLKGYLAKLKDNYYADFFDDMGDNPYTPIFYTAFLKISNEPPDKGFIMSSCYSWVKKQPKYLKNPDIKLIVDSINFELNKEK